MTGRETSFRVVAAAGVLFVVLTLAAMALYPGGSVADHHSTRYHFFENFFSDLGQTRTLSGRTNTTSMALFAGAMTAAACALGFFFVAFSGFFQRSATARGLAAAAAVCGLAAGAGFLGVAATPWNLHLAAHNEFVIWAFRAFLAAVVLSTAAILLEPGFPRRFAGIFAVFGALLVAYLLLLTFGPPLSTPEGSRVQATGQKVIVYASILTVLAQALAARSLAREGPRTA